jgi:hypothetical protein
VEKGARRNPRSRLGHLGSVTFTSMHLCSIRIWSNSFPTAGPGATQRGATQCNGNAYRWVGGVDPAAQAVAWETRSVFLGGKPHRTASEI